MPTPREILDETIRSANARTVARAVIRTPLDIGGVKAEKKAIISALNRDADLGTMPVVVSRLHKSAILLTPNDEDALKKVVKKRFS
jgi:hypothetical protein